jgi:hypothetical protein
MKQHPYLRAYMAGIVCPTPLMLLALVGFVIARVGYRLSVPIEQVIIFPMGVVPNAWGVWNMLFLLLHRHGWLPIGLHGALLSVVLVPLGVTMARLFGISYFTPEVGATVMLGILPIYYLLWKHLVSYLNALVGISG